jgi:glutamine synthetase
MTNNKVDALIKNDVLEFAQFEYVDQAGTVRGKLGNIEDLGKIGAAAACINGVRGGEEIVMTPLAGLMDGVHKRPIVYDPDTAFQMSWRPNTAAILGRMTRKDGSLHDHCPRSILETILKKLNDHGYTSMVGFENEFYVFEDDDDAIREGRIKDLSILGRNRNAYSLSRQHYIMPIAEEMFRRMKSVGAPLEIFHTEYSRGMYEFAFQPLEGLAAADGLARSRLYLKELLNENGLTTTAMTALHAVENANHSGIHANISFWKDGKNAFWDGDGLSELGQQFVAGVLATMDDFHIIMRPWVNSYRRFDPEAFCPVHAAWGEDNHLVALRMTHGSVPEKQTRIEHRVAGTDTCPHLVLAAIIYGGLYGIENKLELPAQAKIEELEEMTMLTHTLPLAIEKFKGSKVARDAFGDAFVEHYCQVREEECADFEAYCKDNDIEVDYNGPDVTEWEYQRYFDWLV